MLIVVVERAFVAKALVDRIRILVRLDRERVVGNVDHWLAFPGIERVFRKRNCHRRNPSLRSSPLRTRKLSLRGRRESTARWRTSRGNLFSRPSKSFARIPGT